MRMESGGLAPPLLTSSQYGNQWPASRAGLFRPTERAPGFHWVGGWVVGRACQDTGEGNKYTCILLLSCGRECFLQKSLSYFTNYVNYSAVIEITQELRTIIF